MDISPDAIFYFRVSTEAQATDGHGFEYYYHLGKQLGFSDDNIYSDVASGGDNTRPGYQLVLARIRAGCKEVYVPDLSRLTRSVGGWEDAIGDFRMSGARLITLDAGEQRLDTPEALLISRMRVAQAAFWREQTQYKSLKGLEFKRLRGEAFQAKFPYKLGSVDGRDTLIPNEDQYKDSGLSVWSVGRELISTYLANHGNVSRTLEIMIQRFGRKPKGMKPDPTEFPHSNVGLRAWLDSEEIRGYLEYYAEARRKPKKTYSLGRKPVPQIIQGQPDAEGRRFTHFPLVSVEEGAAIRAHLAISSQRRRNTDRVDDYLQGLMWCAVCGGRMRLARANQPAGKRLKAQGIDRITHYYIVCRGANPRHQNDVVTCTSKGAYSLEIEDIDEVIIQLLTERANAAIDVAHEAIERESEEVTKLREQIRKYELLAADDPDMLTILNKKRADLAALQPLVRPGSTSELHRELQEMGKDPDFWRCLTNQEKLILYVKFVERVTCDRGRFTVTLKI
jgi:DNA invertase Pin-like site-specific DNA recombinase